MGCDRGASDRLATQEGFVRSTDGTSISYQVAGSGPDTIVVVHGGPGAGANSIRPDLEPLTLRHVVIFYDQRGGGKSELPSDTTRLNAEAFVQDLDAVRAHFQLRSINLVAHSFGAVISALYAMTYPDRVSRVILLAATGPSHAIAARFYQRGPVGLDSASATRQFLALQSLMDGTAADPEAACRTLEAIGKLGARNRGEFTGWAGSSCTMPLEALRYYWRYTARLGPEAFGEWDFTHSLKNVTAPFLIVSGGTDTLALAMDRAWEAIVPSGRLVSLPTTSRATYAELPEQTFRAIDDFLAGRAPGGASPR